MDAENSKSDETIFYDAICKESTFENSEIDKDNETSKNPNLDIARLKFLLTLPEYANDESKYAKLVEFIKENSMAPYYEQICEELKRPINRQFLKVYCVKNTPRMSY